MYRLAWRALIVISILATGFAWLPSPAAVHAESSFERWGFYVTYDPESRRSLAGHIGKLDVVVPNYFKMQADGTVTGADDPQVDALVVGAGRRLMPLVQNNARNGDLSPLLNNADARQRAISNVSQMVSRYGYAGITLDFEAVQPSDRAGMTAFIVGLANALHDRGKQLAVAIPAKSRDLAIGWA